MFANRRTPSVNGRIMLLISSIEKISGVINIAIPKGSLGPAKWPKCFTNPFSLMQASPKIQLKRLMTDAPSLIVACGLAMRRFDPQ